MTISGTQIGKEHGADPRTERIGLRGGPGKKAAGIPPWRSEHGLMPDVDVHGLGPGAHGLWPGAYAPAPSNI